MRLYLELVKLSFQRTLTYRTAALAGLATNLFFGLLRAAVMVALYGARTDVSGISLQGAITFTGISQALLAFLSIFSWFEVMNEIRTGDIGAELLRPFSFFGYWMARDAGRALSNLLLRGFTMVAAYALLFHITYPSTPGQWAALVVALILAWVVGFAWRFLVNLVAFWSTEARGIARFAFAMALFLSGFVMPLRFFPDWFVALCNLTPFPAMVNTVIEVYLGVLTGPALAQALAVQAMWFVVLAGLAQLVMRAGMRRLVIQGG